MKTSMLQLLAVVTAVAFTGCNKPQQPSAAPETATQPAPQPSTNTAAAAAAAMQAAGDKAEAAVQAQTAAVQNAASQVTTDAQAQAASLTSNSQSIIDRAKKLLADNKPADALKALGELVNAKLTPEQQSAVDALKTRAEELMQKVASTNAVQKATDALGGLLKK